MANHIAKAEEFERKADKKLGGWGFLGSTKYEDAVDFYKTAASSFKLAKSCNGPRFLIL